MANMNGVLQVEMRGARRERCGFRPPAVKKYGFVPDKLITDDLRSYAAAASDLGIAKRHERGRWRNNRAVSLGAFSSPQHLQRPTSSHIGKNAPSLQDIGDADMARSRRRGVSPTCQQNSYVLSLAI